MNQTFSTPQETEDAYYDALEGGDLEQLTAIWEDADDISCLLPMQPLAQGRQGVREAFAELLTISGGVELSVTHLSWIETDNLAIHQVQETAGSASGGPPPMAVYAINIYRRGAAGWRLVVHQNAPLPPPPGMAPPMGPPGMG